MATEPLAVVPGQTVSMPPTYTDVAASITSVILAPSNVYRRMVLIYNDSTAHLSIKFGAAATFTNFNVRLQPQGYFEFPMPIFLGSIQGVWDSATGFAKVTEFI